MSAKCLPSLLPALAAVAALAAAAGAQAQGLDPLTVQGPLPTVVHLKVAGLDRHEVVKAVDVAAHTVCRNAYDNHQIDLGDLQLCPVQAVGVAMTHYDRVVHRAQPVGEVRLAAR